MQTYTFFSRDERGFSLVELLMVITIMSVLVWLSTASLPGVLSTYKRKGAVDVVMTTIEQARVAALRSGENVYVILAKPIDSGVTPDSIIVAGDQPIGSTSTGLVLYTPWTRLPQNIRFRSSSGTLASVSPLPTTSIGLLTTALLPPIGGSPTLSAFTFNSTGIVSYPSTGSGSNGGFDLALYEGIRALHGETARGPSARETLNLSDSGMYEVIRLSQYTGRSWMDISTLVQK